MSKQGKSLDDAQHSPINKKNNSLQGSTDVKKLAALNSLENFSPKLTYLGSKKEKSVPHYHGNKVNTCSYVKMRGSQPVAIPFYKHPSKPLADLVSKSAFASSLSQ
jgi:hypothetical protein